MASIKALLYSRNLRVAFCGALLLCVGILPAAAFMAPLTPAALPAPSSETIQDIRVEGE